MSGDGLVDLVRIFNGEVCYWPNLGYGRFGAKVTMDNAPWFASPDLFDQRRVRLADIDGSGNQDIVYLAHDGIDLYFNQSGNSWSEPHRLSQFPVVDNLAAITQSTCWAMVLLAWSGHRLCRAMRAARYTILT